MRRWPSMTAKEENVRPGRPEFSFASDAWFDRSRALTGNLPLQPGIRWRLQFDVVDDDGGHESWFQEVEDGRVAAWAVGELDSADLELRWRREDARSLYRGELSGTEALAATGVVLPDGSAGPAPPLDLRDAAGLDELPSVPGATLAVQYQFAGGPFGPVDYWMAFGWAGRRD